MFNENPVDYPVNPLSRQRWSPYAFDADRSVSREDLEGLFEAARWAMSSFNAQPWRYIVGVKERDRETWDAVFETLLEGNRGWAQHVPVLALGLVERHFEHNGKPNRHAAHDLGAASASLSYEAAARGQLMIAREEYKIAVGHYPNGLQVPPPSPISALHPWGARPSSWSTSRPAGLPRSRAPCPMRWSRGASAGTSKARNIHARK